MDATDGTHTGGRDRHRRAPGLNGHLPLRDAWVWALTACVDRAIAAAAAPDRDLRKAVHDQRRALRAARAAVRLARPLLGRPACAALIAPLAAAMRATAPLRDAAVAAELLACFRGGEAGSALARLHSSEPDPYADAGAVRAQLRRAGEGVADVPDRFLGALPARVEWIHVERGLRSSYRRTRRSLRAALHTPDDAAVVHALRKRVKELRDQLALFAGGEGGQLSSHQRTLAEWARALGDVTDRWLLHGYARARAARLPPETADRLLRGLQADAGRRAAKAVRAGRRILARTPRAASSRWVDRIVP